MIAVLVEAGVNQSVLGVGIASCSHDAHHVRAPPPCCLEEELRCHPSQTQQYTQSEDGPSVQ